MEKHQDPLSELIGSIIIIACSLILFDYVLRFVVRIVLQIILVAGGYLS